MDNSFQVPVVIRYRHREPYRTYRPLLKPVMNTKYYFFNDMISSGIFVSLAAIALVLCKVSSSVKVHSLLTYLSYLTLSSIKVGASRTQTLDEPVK